MGRGTDRGGPLVCVAWRAWIAAHGCDWANTSRREEGVARKERGDKVVAHLVDRVE